MSRGKRGASADSTLPSLFWSHGRHARKLEKPSGIAPGRFPEFPCARRAGRRIVARVGGDRGPVGASRARTRHLTATSSVLIADAGRTRPRWAHARSEPRARRARGGGRRRDGKWARRIGLDRRRCRSGPCGRGGRRQGRRGDAPCVEKQRSTRRALRRCVSRCESGATRSAGRGHESTSKGKRGKQVP